MSESRLKPKVRPRPADTEPVPAPMQEEPQRDPPIDPEQDLTAEWPKSEQPEKQGVLFDENHVPG